MWKRGGWLQRTLNCDILQMPLTTGRAKNSTRIVGQHDGVALQTVVPGKESACNGVRALLQGEQTKLKSIVCIKRFGAFRNIRSTCATSCVNTRCNKHQTRYNDTEENQEPSLSSASTTKSLLGVQRAPVPKRVTSEPMTNDGLRPA